MPLLAVGTEDLPVPGTLNGPSRDLLGGVFPVLASVLVLICGLLVWAVFFRKSTGRRERGRLLDGRPAPRSSSSADSGSKSSRRRRRREKQRPRNPTLSETGGLPPIGAGDSKPPPL